MIANALFYTFSTISQTLAGAIALLGAFVLYRLQSLNLEIEEESSSVVGRYGLVARGYSESNQKAVMELHDEQKYREVVTFIANTPLPPSVDQANRVRSSLVRHLDQKDALMKAFKFSLWLTVGLVVASVAALSWTPALVESPWANASLVVAVAWFSVCMASYGILVYRAFK